MKALVYVILGVMVLLLVASFFLPSCGPDISNSNVMVISNVSATAPASQYNVTVVSALDGAAPQVVGQSVPGTPVPQDLTMQLQSMQQRATEDWNSRATAQAGTQVLEAAAARVTDDFVQAYRAVESQTLQALLAEEPTDGATPLAAQALATQTRSAENNLALAAARTVEAQAVETAVAYGPTATVYMAQVSTVQAQMVVTVQAAKADLAKIEAQISKAESSLTEMKAMGLSTDDALTSLKSLQAQAEQKVKALESQQSQLKAQGGMSPGWYGPGSYGSMGSMTYIVQLGDTLYSIAQRFGVSVEELAMANGVSPYQNLRVGQALVIPFHYPGSGTAPGSVPGPDATYMYVVQPGDTMFSIARRFGVPLSELAMMNGIIDLNHIWVGQNLMIPSTAPAQYPQFPPQPLPTYQPPYSPQPVPTYFPPYPPPLTLTPAPGGNDVYFSGDGKFSVQYPRSWQWGTDVPGGFMMFWARQGTSPSLPGFAVFSKRSSVWRSAKDVLDSYKNDLTAYNLMGSIWGSVSFTWDGGARPYALGSQLAMGELGYAGSNRVLVRATSRDDGTREYLALTWAPSNQWEANQSVLESLLNTLAFTD